MKNFFKHKFRKKSPVEIFAIIIFGALAISGLAVLLGYVIMSLWNWLMPSLFNLPELTYWQAVGLFILLKLLLGGCGGRGGKNCDKSEKKCSKNSKSDFSKWKHYDEFWEEEGDLLYKKYLQNKQDTTPE